MRDPLTSEMDNEQQPVQTARRRRLERLYGALAQRWNEPGRIGGTAGLIVGMCTFAALWAAVGQAAPAGDFLARVWFPLLLSGAVHGLVAGGLAWVLRRDERDMCHLLRPHDDVPGGMQAQRLLAQLDCARGYLNRAVSSGRELLRSDWLQMRELVLQDVEGAGSPPTLFEQRKAYGRGFFESTLISRCKSRG